MSLKDTKIKQLFQDNGKDLRSVDTVAKKVIYIENHSYYSAYIKSANPLILDVVDSCSVGDDTMKFFENFYSDFRQQLEECETISDIFALSDM